MRFALLALVPFLLPALPVAAAHPIDSRFLVEIAPSQTGTQPGIAVWKLGTPVGFIITMTNNSEQVLHFNLTNPAFNYRLIVVDSGGKPVRETETFQRMRENVKRFGFTTRNILVELKPHQSCTDTIGVSNLYDLSKPGQYTIQLERDLPRELGNGVVTSNTVRITIEQPAPSSAPQQITIKDPAEYAAYLKVIQTPNPPDKAQLAESFLQQYPNTALKRDALNILLMAYQRMNHEDDIVRTAKRLLEYDPGHLSALAVLAYTYRECAIRGGSMAQQCLLEAIKYGREGLQVLANDPKPPFEMPPQEFENWKTNVRPTFEAAAGLESPKDKTGMQPTH